MLRDTNVIKKEISEQTEAIKSLEKKNATAERTKTKINHRLDSIEVTLSSLILTEEKKGKVKQLKDADEPLVKKIEQGKQKLQEIEKHRETSLAKLKSSNIEGKINEVSPLDDGTYEIINDLKFIIASEYGDSFLDVYYKQLEKIKVDYNKIPKYIKQLKSTVDNVQQLSENKGNQLILGMKEIIGTISNNLEDMTADIGNNIILQHSSPILMNLALSPLILIIQVVDSLVAPRYYKELQKAIIYLFIVESNKEEVEKIIRSKAEEILDTKEKEINEAYDKQKEELTKKVQELEQQRIKEQRKIEQEYKFDDTEIRDKAKKQIEEMRKNIEELNVQIETTKAEIEERTLNLANLKNELNAIIQVEIKKYIDPEYKERIIDFPTKMLFEFEPTIKYFEPINKATAIFYNDRNLIVNYINTSIFQIRNQVDAGLLEFYILDIINMCKEFLNSYMHLAEAYNPINLLYEEEEISGKLDNLKKKYKRDYVTMMLEKRMAISEYNKYMLENESIPAKYSVIYLLDPPIKYLEQLSPLIRIGHDLGIYITYFIHQDIDINEYKEFLDATAITVKMTEVGILTYKIDLK